MSESRTARVTVISGVLFVVLFIVAFLAFTRSGFPDSGDPAAKIAAYLGAHRGAMLAQQVCIGASFLAAAVFIGGLVTLMWRTEAARPLAVIAAVGGAAAGGMGLMGSALFTTLAYRPPVGDPGLMRTLLDAGYVTFNTSGWLLAAFIGATSVAALATRALPRWTGDVGLPVAALQILGAMAYARGDGGLSPQGWVTIVAALGFVVWIGCVCVALRRPQEAVSPAPAPA